MRFLSVCSGIEAASVAWRPLGWRAHAFAEIEAFPRAVLAHHYPGVPNYGDMTKFKEWPDADVDVLVGGTSCQSFSIAGLRAGLDDPRGYLMLTYAAIARRYRPKWLVWENVPGVLSDDAGRSFASLLGLLSGQRIEVPRGGWETAGFVEGYGRAYGLAWRVLDAQFVRVDGFARAVPQRRRRVFVVGYLGDWRRAAAVLFERESLSGYSAPRREAGKRAASTLGASAARRRGLDDRGDPRANLIAFGGNNQSGPIDVATACRAKGGSGHGDFESETFVMLASDVAGTLGNNGKAAGTATGHDAANGLLLPICFDETQITNSENRCNPQPGDPSHPLASGARPPTIAFSAKDHGADAMLDCSPTLRAGGHSESHAKAGVMPAIAFDARQSDVIQHGEITGPLDTDASTMGIMERWRVRRLMPVECERLQGFPEITKCVTIRAWDWSDKAKNAALAEMLNRKSQKSVLNADANELVRSAETAESHSNAYHQSHGSRAAVNVRINSERSEVEIRRTGKLIWSARIAERPSASPLLMPLDDFVRLVAPMLTMLESGIHAGAEELPASINASSHPLNGSACVNLSGDEIAENVGDADKFTAAINNCMRFTTSGVGRSSPNSEPLWKTWCCCVVHAIGSCIPDETRATSSFDLSVELVSGYTAIPYRGKPSADGPRYKALGNSFAVNVMRWIGQRIQIADSI